MEESKFAHSIQPKSKWVDLRLKEIWAFRDLLMLFVHRDFVAYYKQTMLGPLWFFVQPLLTTVVFTLVFGKFAKIPTDGLPAPLFYMAGITAWNFFSEGLKKSSNTFVQNAGIFGKVYFPRAIVPLSNTITNLLAFGIQFLLFLFFLFYYQYKGADVHQNIYVLLLPVLIFLMGFMGLGLGMLFSAMTAKYRDFQFLLTFAIQLFMYATPVIYSVSSVPAKYQWLIHANPMTSIIETFRFSFLGTGSFRWQSLAYSTVFTIAIFVLGLIVFNRTEKNFMDTV